MSATPATPRSTTRGGHRPVVGVALGVIGVVHLALAPVLYGESLKSIADAGVLAAVDSDPTAMNLRSAAFWYISTGVALLLVAVVVGQVERTEGVPPASAVVGLLVLAVWGLLLMPVSGFIAVLAVALLAAYRRRRQRPAQPAP